MRGTIWIVVVVFVLGAVGFGAAGSFAAEETVEVRSVENETHTLDTQDPVTLGAADDWTSMYHNETVTDENGSVLERGTEYEINYTSGELTAASTTTDGEQVRVTYAYDWQDATSSGISAVLSVALAPLLGLIAIVAAVGAFANWLGVM